jgi:hypothetical protein
MSSANANNVSYSFKNLKGSDDSVQKLELMEFGPCPSSGILIFGKHNVSETGSISVFREGGEKSPTLLGPLERANLKSLDQQATFIPHPPHLRMETDPVSETLSFLVFRIPNDVQSPKPQQF